LFYSTSFGGAYWLWMLVLSTFIIQAVSYEYRNKPNNVLGKKTFEWFLFLNGFIGTVSLGVAVATMFTGGNFMHNEMNFTSWTNSYHGLEAFTNPINLALGLAVFFLSRTLAILYFLNTVKDTNIQLQSRKHLLINAPLFLVFFLAFMFAIWLGDGYAYNSITGEVFTEPNKYFFNMIESPVVGILFLLGVLFVLMGLFRGIFCFTKCNDRAIWPVGIGAFLAVLSLFLNLGYNNTVFYPSLVDMQCGLTIRTASSSQFTLTVMSYVSLLLPFVAAYIIFAWRAINKKKIDKDEMESETHLY
jgi:cytochrome d ubiquinol oxidase subunit II